MFGKTKRRRDNRQNKPTLKHSNRKLVYNKLQRRVEKSLLQHLSRTEAKGAPERNSQDISLYHKSLSNYRYRKQNSD